MLGRLKQGSWRLSCSPSRCFVCRLRTIPAVPKQIRSEGLAAHCWRSRLRRPSYYYKCIGYVLQVANSVCSTVLFDLAAPADCTVCAGKPCCKLGVWMQDSLGFSARKQLELQGLRMLVGFAPQVRVRESRFQCRNSRHAGPDCVGLIWQRLAAHSACSPTCLR